MGCHHLALHLAAFLKQQPVRLTERMLAEVIWTEIEDGIAFPGFVLAMLRKLAQRLHAAPTNRSVLLLTEKLGVRHTHRLLRST
jgi:hypothetical protein